MAVQDRNPLAGTQPVADPATVLLTQLIDQHTQIIKLLAAILMTLGNNGNGWVDPEEASQLSSLQ